MIRREIRSARLLPMPGHGAPTSSCISHRASHDQKTSSRKYDRVIKLGYYLRIRVPEYWIVDPEARTVERLVLRKGQYVIEQTAAGKSHFRPRSLANLDIPLTKLWL